MVFKGQMVGKGTFAELLQSGVDFASLLKNGEEELPEGQLVKSSRIRTFSQSSVWSQESSVQSQKEGAADTLPVSSGSLMYRKNMVIKLYLLSLHNNSSVSGDNTHAKYLFLSDITLVPKP